MPSSRPPQDTEALFSEILNAAYAVHTALGPGLLESAYAKCLKRELQLRGISSEAEVALPVEYRGEKVDCAYRLDLLVEGRIIVELKSVAELPPLHVAQLMSYIRIAGHSSGLLINFNVKSLRDGIRRVYALQKRKS